MFRFRLIHLAAASTLSFGVTAAHAEDHRDDGRTIIETGNVAIDAVVTRGGAIITGRVTEVVQNERVTVRMESGELRTIAWSDITRVVLANHKASEATSSSARTPTARVHINAPRPSQLYRRAAGTEQFVAVCQTPCDADMPIGDTYKIAGAGFKTTPEFRLDAAPGETVELKVDGPNWAGIVGGGVLTLLGGLTAYVGATIFLSTCGGDACADSRSVGLGAMGLGGLALAAGLAIVQPSMKTDLSVQKDRASNDAWLRTPVWRTASLQHEGQSAAPMTLLPLAYTGRF